MEPGTLIAVAGVIVAAAAAGGGWIVRGMVSTAEARSRGDGILHKRINDLNDKLPNDYVPRRELNGRLDRVRERLDSLHEDNRSLRRDVAALGTKLDTLLERRAKPRD